MISSSINELQYKVIESIKHLSEIKNINVKDNFIQEKLCQISEQETELRKFAVDHNFKMCTHAEDLIRFAECCEGDNVSSEKLIESLRKLNDEKLNGNKCELLNKIVNVKNSLEEIVNEIADYNEKITEGHTEWNDKINKVVQNKNEATTFAKTSLMIIGIGSIAVTATIPFTAGASLLLIPAKAVFTLGASLISQCTFTAVVSGAVVGASSIHKDILNNELKGIKEQISQLLRETQEVLEDINDIIKHCESNFEKQIAEIEEVEKIVDVLKKLDDTQLVKPIAKTISTRARKNSLSYNNVDVDVRIRDPTLPVIVDIEAE